MADAVQINTNFGVIRDGDIIQIGRFNSTRWVAHYGWFALDGNRSQLGWYLTSEDYSCCKPLLKTDLDDCYMVENISPLIDSIDIPGTTTKLPINSIVTLADDAETQWILQYGRYENESDTYQESTIGWYFRSIPYGNITPVTDEILEGITIISMGYTCNCNPTPCPPTDPNEFTPTDELALNSAFITVQSIADRDALSASDMEDGKIVNIADTSECYRYDKPTNTWTSVSVISTWETV